MVVIDAALLVPQEIEALGVMQLIKTLRGNQPESSLCSRRQEVPAAVRARADYVGLDGPVALAKFAFN